MGLSPAAGSIDLRFLLLALLCLGCDPVSGECVQPLGSLPMCDDGCPTLQELLAGCPDGMASTLVGQRCGDRIVLDMPGSYRVYEEGGALVGLGQCTDAGSYFCGVAYPCRRHGEGRPCPRDAVEGNRFPACSLAGEF